MPSPAVLIASALFLAALVQGDVSLTVVPSSISYGYSSNIAIQVTADLAPGDSGYAYFYFQNGVKTTELCPRQTVDSSGSPARCIVTGVANYEPGQYGIFASVVSTSISVNSTTSTLIVNKQTPSIALIPSSTNSLFGDTVSFTTLITAPGNGYLPSGTFTLYQNTTQVAVIALNGTFVSPELPVGAYSYSLVYSGDGHYVSQSTTAPGLSVADNILFEVLENPADYGIGLGYTVRCSSPYVKHLVFYSVAGNSPRYDISCTQARSSFIVPSFGIGNWTVQLSWPGDASHPPIVKTALHQIIRARSVIKVTTPALNAGAMAPLKIEILPNELLGDLQTATGLVVASIDNVTIFSASLQDKGTIVYGVEVSKWNNTVDHKVIVSYSGDTYYSPVIQTFLYPKAKTPAPSPFRNDGSTAPEDGPDFSNIRGAAPVQGGYRSLWITMALLLLVVLNM